MQITHTDPHRVTRGAVSATATFYSATCIVLYKHVAVDSTIAQRACNAVGVINRRQYDQPWCQLDHNCDHQISTTTRLLMTQHIPPPEHRRGRGPPWQMDTNLPRLGIWAEDFSNSRKNANFTYPTCIWRWRPSSWSHRNFVEIFCIMKLQSLGYRMALCAWSYI